MNILEKFAIFIVLAFMSSCEDEKISLQRVPYIGNEIRTDGYYYKHWVSKDNPPENSTSVFFLYRNGIKLTVGSYSSFDLEIVEKKMLNRYESIVKQKSGWGVFVVTKNKIEFECWTTSVGGGLPVYKDYYYIENDTTLRSPYGEI
jgi:hypothetical protein